MKPVVVAIGPVPSRKDQLGLCDRLHRTPPEVAPGGPEPQPGGRLQQDRLHGRRLERLTQLLPLELLVAFRCVVVAHLCGGSGQFLEGERDGFLDVNGGRGDEGRVVRTG